LQLLVAFALVSASQNRFRIVIPPVSVIVAVGGTDVATDAGCGHGTDSSNFSATAKV
jgi:hypothetical protein